MAQAVHAGFLFAQKHPEVTAQWLTDSQFIIIVSVPSEDHLLALACKARNRNVPAVLWSEPDLDDELTAVAFAPVDEARRLCANLPLAGHGRRLPVTVI
jgi:peptidyl-tRNA hydrolase